MAVASSGALLVVNPASLELVATVPATDPAHVQERRALLRRVASLVLERLDATKLVDRDSGRIPAPWWFPYDDRSAAALRVLYGRDRLRSAWEDRRALLDLARRYLR